VAVAAGCALGGAQPAVPQGTAPAVEIDGRIVKIDLDRGDGTPLLEVKGSSGRVWSVRLAPMHYLVEQDFNPKAGQAVSIKGYPQPALPGNKDKKKLPELVAVSVTLTGSGRTVRLPDAVHRPEAQAAPDGRRN
jgi:hypothetical protein